MKAEFHWLNAVFGLNTCHAWLNAGPQFSSERLFASTDVWKPLIQKVLTEHPSRVFKKGFKKALR